MTNGKDNKLERKSDNDIVKEKEKNTKNYQAKEKDNYNLVKIKRKI